MNEEYTSKSTGPYRSRKGLIFGVCQGLADHLEVSVVGLRIATVVLSIFTGIWPLGFLYLLAALLMKPAPVLPFQGEADAEFYQSYTSSSSMALHRLKRTYDSLDRRIQRIESIVTAKDYDWDRRLHEDAPDAPTMT